MRNLYLALSWYLSSISALIFSILLLIYISSPHVVSAQTGPHYQLYQALPSGATYQQVEITATDARTILVENFFKSYNAPLADEAENFIKVSDKYGLDYRLLPAIAMQESLGGKIVPNNSFNPFGYGVYGGQVIHFSSWDDAIDSVASGLRSNYIDQGLKTPAQIMTKYTPPSLAKGGAWAIGVSSFMAEIN